MSLVSKNGATRQASRQNTTQRTGQLLRVFRQQTLPFHPPNNPLRPFRALPCPFPAACTDYVTPKEQPPPPGSPAPSQAARSPKLHNRSNHRSHHRSRHRSRDRTLHVSAPVSVDDPHKRTSRYASCTCVSADVCHTLKNPLYRRPPFRRTPAKGTIPQAAYTSLTLLICLLLLLPPCADSLSRSGRRDSNVTLTGNANNHNSATAAAPLTSLLQQQSGSSATSLSSTTTSHNPQSCWPFGESKKQEQAQCLLLTRETARYLCGEPTRSRTPIMRKLRLRFCDKYWLYHVIGPQCVLTGNESECIRCLDSVIEKDLLVNNMYHNFLKVLEVVEDCAGNFSTHWSCHDCKVSPFRQFLSHDTITPQSIHTKDESKRGSAFAFIFGVN